MALMEIRSATITEKGQIVIPKLLREKEGFKTGSKVSILAFEDHLEVRPLSAVSESMECALMSEESLAKEWNTPEEDKAWAYLKEEWEKRKKARKG
jgi:AbrB family looped-hinge helix DNA binding protein